MCRRCPLLRTSHATWRSGLSWASRPASCWLSRLEHLDRSVKSPEDVERDLRLPFLGAIPAFENSWKAGDRRSLDGDRHARRRGQGCCTSDFGSRGLLGKLSLAQDFPAVFFPGRAAAQHSGDVRTAGRGKEHHDREPGGCPRADGGAHAHPRAGYAPAQARRRLSAPRTNTASVATSRARAI